MKGKMMSCVLYIFVLLAVCNVVYLLFTYGLPFVAIAQDRSAVQIFFNASNKKSSSIESDFIRFIRSAQKSFDGAFYDISSGKVADCLIELHRKGVKVRLVMESDSQYRKAVQKMMQSGIMIVFDTSPGLMHHKFAVVDGDAVWTGSYNPVSGAASHDNNAVLIRSRQLAARFLEEFNDMYERQLFGRARRGRPFERFGALFPISVDGIRINAFFSPRHRIERIIEDVIHNARSRIHFLAFSFTSNSIADAMIDRIRKGITIEGIMEERGVGSEFSEYMKFRVEGINVLLRRGRGVMHHKVIIIDGRIIVTGSFNFSRGADAINDENILIIESEEIAQKFLAEFYRIAHRCEL
ncbi:MAG: phospholipase D-like domain-containing protein [Spirochaetes bacterium]|nr:phospholipase D-like domain-containing protein [Spirochaetota bacterium]